MRTLTILIASFAAAVALVLPGCGDSGTAETAKGGGGAASAATLSNEFEVTMGEWFFRVDHARVKAGKVTVTARNVGDIEHELIAVKTDLAADEMPMTPEGLDVDEAGKLAIGEPHEHGHEAGDEHGDDEHMDEVDEHGDEAGDMHADEVAEEGHLMAGETRRYQVDLKPGKYVLLCSIPGHYDMGQYVGLVAAAR